MSPVAVAGMHRTGSSMVAKSLRLAGLHIGHDDDLIPAAPDNPEGFFEHAGIVQVNDDLLEAAGGAWDHPPSCVPLGADDPRVETLRGTAEEVLAKLAVDQPWGWKDPRTCLTSRFWLDLVPELRVIVCVRNPLEVALSLKRRNRTSYGLAISLWHTYYETLLDIVPPEQRAISHYDVHLGAGATAEVGRLVAYAGLPADALADANGAPDPALRHHWLDVPLADAGLDSGTVELYARLCAEAGYDAELGGCRRRARHDHVRRDQLDLALTGHHLEQRTRQVESLQRERLELQARVAALEAATHPATGLLDGLDGRLAALEAAVHDLRYRHEDLGGRKDASVIRGCRELVRTLVPPGEQVLVVAKGDAALLDLYGWPTANFPQSDDGKYPGYAFGHAAAAIGHLEAQRACGARHFLLPESARWWLDHLPAFADHLAARYHVVADEAGVGVLVELSRRFGSQLLAETLDRLVGAAVLDWTDLNLAAGLPGRNVFAPALPDDVLPYADQSIDVAVIDDAARAADARRVAMVAVVVVRAGDLGRPLVEAVDGPLAEPSSVTFVPLGGEPDAALYEALADEPGAEIASEPAGSVAVFVEPGVVPLPGFTTAVAVTLEQDPSVGAVAAKLLAADGSIEAAGTMRLADGTGAGVASGSVKVAAPWHDYVRDVDGGAGLLAVRGEALDRLGDDPAAWCDDLRAAGFRVRYQPEAVAVRTSHSRVSGLRFPQPSHSSSVVLDAREWRVLLAQGVSS